MYSIFTSKFDFENKHTLIVQVDIEMSFADRDTILDLTEQLVAAAWPHKIQLPLPRLTYDHVMNNYGSDKPDLR